MHQPINRTRGTELAEPIDHKHQGIGASMPPLWEPTMSILPAVGKCCQPSVVTRK
jgi:hypothetical protein